MKAAKQTKPDIPAPRTPDPQPAGTSQLRVDRSARQGAQRDYLDHLQAHARAGDAQAQPYGGMAALAANDRLWPERESGTMDHQAVQRTTATQAPAQLVKGNTNAKKKKKVAKVARYRRFKTAYGVATGTGNQGPHTVPHIGKRVAVENAYRRNKKFQIRHIRERTGLIPSPGQARRIIRILEKRTKTKIPKSRKIRFDREYKKLIKAKNSGSSQERDLATLKLFELNPLGTYSLHQPASHGELKGKGERRTTVEPDLVKMSKMKKGGKVPKFSKVDIPKKPQHRQQDLEKFYRDTGKLYKGEDDHSDLELSSDDEY